MIIDVVAKEQPTPLSSTVTAPHLCSPMQSETSLSLHPFRRPRGCVEDVVVAHQTL
ncbi:hypothetical protein BJY04DRAFT_196023 [Aspergillus karnatakaensis]|uniref:uncharacterized protein n=1 Tax=Aspergillus karnatakaensis TaxID=1810916 RepID=UPI003CCCD9D1